MQYRGALLAALLSLSACASAAPVTVETDPRASPRILFGIDQLTSALKSAGDAIAGAGTRIEVGTAAQPIMAAFIQNNSLRADDMPNQPESFALFTTADGQTLIIGGDDSGAMYGCLELANRIRQAGKLPIDLRFSDGPAMKLRGPCIGMQKTYILPGHKVYEYPYTPELFPFFYDRQFWSEYLDFLAENRFNVLYLWNGHPFASLVKLADYPFALEVSEDQLKANREMFRWITDEADRRGIWTVQMFYSIVLSRPFADHFHISTQLKEPTPEAADYMRKSIAEFVHQYPHVGLMVCLGEALQGIDNQKAWLDETVIGGVHDGMKLADLKDDPPLIVRSHATDLRKFLPESLKLYPRIYTESKFNGESLTTYEPRGVRQQLQLDLSKAGSTNLMNVHILANLEPFRYGAQRFIKKCVQAGRDRLDARGLHLYPLCYWNWPDAPDRISPPLKQWRRDWIWFEAWGRYAWNPDIKDATDHDYWVKRIAAHYGASAAENILAAYNDAGECAPRLLRRYGITEGNRQTLSLGMTLDELVKPDKYHAFPELWESQSPPGERLAEYVEKEWKRQPHSGETPVSINQEVLDFSRRAVDEIDSAEPVVASEREEFERVRNDVHCIREMSAFYVAKSEAALHVLRFDFSHEPADMKIAKDKLAESLDHYRTLTALTTETYRFANSMQTSQRAIPVRGGANGQPANYHWSQLLPVYEQELVDFKKKVADVDEKVVPATAESVVYLESAVAKVLSPTGELYPPRGQRPFANHEGTIGALAPELSRLTGIRLIKGSSPAAVQIECDQPSKLLIGYVASTDPQWKQPPAGETDAAAGERGEAEPLITSAATITGTPRVDVYIRHLPAGKNTIDFGSGDFAVFGVVPEATEIQKRDAGLPPGKR